MTSYDYKSTKRLYDTARWRRLRRIHLAQFPLCDLCEKKGLTVPADVVHHVTPHKGDLVLFWTGKLQSLCKHCHDGTAQQVERSGFANDIGVDGWPIDPRHPVYSHR
jgi:5-methylcytosine-specific restriction endonuclease McrA